MFLNNDFTLRSINGRGVAEKMSVAEAGNATLEGVRFTTCAPGNEAWTLTASTISLDQDTGRGEATNALLRFQGVPLFYLPWFQFPIDGLRHSGFLFPIVGNNQNTGFDIRWPVYLNLGSNYDVTLIPRYLSERGAQIGGEGRYLLSSNEGSLFGEYLPSDDKLGGESRSYIDYRHVGALSRSLGVEAKYGYVSDRNYFATFGGGVDLTSTPFLERGVKFTLSGTDRVPRRSAGAGIPDAGHHPDFQPDRPRSGPVHAPAADSGRRPEQEQLPRYPRRPVRRVHQLRASRLGGRPESHRPALSAPGNTISCPGMRMPRAICRTPLTT